MDGFQGYQEWTVPHTGTYTIEVWGASGGENVINSYSAGLGHKILGEFEFNNGDKIQLLVGQQGIAWDYTGGGGGGASASIQHCCA